jgi:antitoxin HicB
MALARWNAVMPADGQRSLGSEDQPSDWPDRSRTALRARRMPRRLAWVYQEVAGDTPRRSGVGAQAPKGVEPMKNKHLGSSIDDFMKEEGIFEEAQAEAVKEVVAWQLAEAMKARNISKSKLAALLKTSRSQVDRLLDPKNDVTLSSLQRAAALVGRRVSVELV